MEHQSGSLHRGGSSVDLCPSLQLIVMVILQGILVQEEHWVRSSMVQSPEEKINLRRTPISLGALVPHPVRPMPQGLVLEGHGAQQGHGRRRPPRQSPCHSLHSGWPRHIQHGERPSQPSIPPVRGATGLHLPASAPSAPPPPAPAACGASAAPWAELSRAEAA